jgi:ElaA protein
LSPPPRLSCAFVPFDALTTHDLYAALALRDRVFVVQQQITCVAEVDGEDPHCTFALLWDEAHTSRALVGTARLFEAQDPVVVGRVAVDTARQRAGLGTALMGFVNAYLGARPAELHAQAHLRAWYEGLGWRAVGPTYLEAEIPHVTMRRP